MGRCTYDTGSMYGCEPVCSREATHVVTYWTGAYGDLSAAVCRGHLSPIQGRLYPCVTSVSEV